MSKGSRGRVNPCIRLVPLVNVFFMYYRWTEHIKKYINTVVLQFGMRLADTKIVTRAQAPDTTQNLADPTTFPSGGPRSPYICPTCNTEQDMIGRHFSSSSCGYPLLTQTEASALVGGWLAGGFLNPPEGRGTPRLIVRSSEPERLSYFNHELGVCGRHSFGMTQSDRTQLNSTPHPRLSDLRDANVSEIRLTREAARVIYELRAEETTDGFDLNNIPHPERLQTVLESHALDSTVGNRTVSLRGEDAEMFKGWAGISSF